MLQDNYKVSYNQKTISNTVTFEGVGLHSGKRSRVSITPSSVDSGIIFLRSDLKVENSIQALWSNVVSTKLCTSISNNKGAVVSTIEHLMSALSGLHIDNAVINIDGPEVPSSEPFVKLFEKAGIVEQNKKRKYIRVLKQVSVENDQGFASISPNNQFSIEIEIEFPSSIINSQSCQLQMINGNYKEDVSRARTFGFEHEVDELRNSGFALGGNLSNAVVVSKDRILNKEGLRYKDEFVRHKILDSIGDLYLAGSPVLGYFEGKRSGHKLNNDLLRKLLKDKSNWVYI